MRHLCTRAIITALLAALTGSTIAIADQQTAQEDEPQVIAETLGVGTVTGEPGKAILQLRVTLEPGAVVPNHVHSGDLVFSVESGSVTYEAVEGSVDVVWATAGTPVAESVIAEGERQVLSEGDWLVEQQGTLHVVSNPTDEPAVLLISAYVNTDEEFLQIVDSDATPAP